MTHASRSLRYASSPTSLELHPCSHDHRFPWLDRQRLHRTKGATWDCGHGRAGKIRLVMMILGVKDGGGRVERLLHTCAPAPDLRIRDLPPIGVALVLCQIGLQKPANRVILIGPYLAIDRGMAIGEELPFQAELRKIKSRVVTA